MDCKPIDFAQKDDEQIWFEEQDSVDASEFSISFFKGSQHLSTVNLDKITDGDIKTILNNI